jgi:hypothetical protein
MRIRPTASTPRLVLLADTSPRALHRRDRRQDRQLPRRKRRHVRSRRDVDIDRTVRRLRAGRQGAGALEANLTNAGVRGIPGRQRQWRRADVRYGPMAWCASPTCGWKRRCCASPAGRAAMRRRADRRSTPMPSRASMAGRRARDGHDRQPQAHVTAARPGLGIGLANLDAQITARPAAIASKATGDTDYGPLTADVTLGPGRRRRCGSTTRRTWAASISPARCGKCRRVRSPAS